MSNHVQEILVKKFTYLGSTLTNYAQLDVEIKNRVAKASSSFGRLRNTVWDRKGLNLQTKLKVYKAVVLTALLYACETWTTLAAPAPPHLEGII